MRHFYQNEFVLRQTCDWCRFLWTYKEKIDIELLEKRLKRAGLVAEWKAFASLAVDTLGMPVEAMPFYDERFRVLGRAKRHSRAKGEKVLKRILKSGNFGHNNDLSYRTKYKGVSYKIIATWRRLLDFASLVPIFPVDAPRFFFTYMFNKAK